MSDEPFIPVPQYTLFDGLITCLALAQRALEEVRALARMPGPEGKRGPKGDAGEKGERGESGAIGPAGRDGLNGPEGKCGPKGDAGEKGERGESGAIGPAGRDGLNGKDGERGKKGEAGHNAADLRLLREHIDEQIAQVLKVSNITTVDGGRTLLVSIAGTVHEVKTAVVLDAGVWTERAYVPGDGVTHGGSFFIAQAETTAKPGKSDDWRLAVKRGNDGRDHRPEPERVIEPLRFK